MLIDLYLLLKCLNNHHTCSKPIILYTPNKTAKKLQIYSLSRTKYLNYLNIIWFLNIILKIPKNQFLNFIF